MKGGKYSAMTLSEMKPSGVIRSKFMRLLQVRLMEEQDLASVQKPHWQWA